MSPRALQKTCSLGSASTDPGTGLSEEAPVSSTSPFPSANAQPTPLSSPQLVPRLKKDTEQASLFPALFIPLCNSLCALFILHSYELTTFVFISIHSRLLVMRTVPQMPATISVQSPTPFLLPPSPCCLPGQLKWKDLYAFVRRNIVPKLRLQKLFFFLSYLVHASTWHNNILNALTAITITKPTL